MNKLLFHIVIVCLLLSVIACIPSHLSYNELQRLDNDKKDKYFANLYLTKQYDKLRMFCEHDLKQLHELKNDSPLHELYLLNTLADIFTMKLVQFSKGLEYCKLVQNKVTSLLNDPDLMKRNLIIPYISNASINTDIAIQYIAVVQESNYKRLHYVYSQLNDTRRMKEISKKMSPDDSEKESAMYQGSDAVDPDVKKRASLFTVVEDEINKLYEASKFNKLSEIGIIKESIDSTINEINELTRKIISKSEEQRRILMSQSTDSAKHLTAQAITAAVLIAIPGLNIFSPWMIAALINNSKEQVDYSIMSNREINLSYESQEQRRLSDILNGVEKLVYFDASAKYADYRNKKDYAIKYADESFNILELLQCNASREHERTGFRQDKRRFYSTMIKIAYRYDQTDKMFSYIESAKSRVLSDLISTRSHIISDDPAFKAFYASYVRDREISASLDLKNMSDSQVRSIDRSIVVKERSKDEDIQGRTVSPQLIRTKPVFVNDLQKFLNKKDAFISYYSNMNNIYRITVTKNKATQRKLSVEIDAIKNKTTDFRKAIHNNNHRKIMDIGQWLFDKLLTDIPDCKNLIISPDGFLYSLPFHALSDHGEYVSQLYDKITYLPNATIIPFLKNNQSRRFQNALIIGNPAKNHPYFDLPFAEIEADNISNSFTNATLVIGDKATKEYFKQHVAGQDIIHFAGHAFSNNEDPLGSFLMFTSELDCLTAFDVMKLPLNSDLVVLSACGTAIQNQAQSSEINGFIRSFFVAGTRSIIVSLWDVEDNSSSRFMMTFYENIKSTKKAEAIVTTYRKMIKNGASVKQWAPFILFGI